MKNHKTLYCFYFKGTITCFLLLMMQSSSAQVNRRCSKSAPTYRTNYQRMSGGVKHTVEIRDGALWAWGDNLFGQLGDGTNNNSASPIRIGTDDNWVSVSSKGFFNLAIKSDGTLWSWGINMGGALGNGTNVNSNIPVQVGTENNWISVSAGTTFSLGLKSDGTLWAWGTNTNGQVGDGTNNDVNVPKQIGTKNNWISIAAGYNQAFGILSNGTLWAWGYNNKGQLGDSTNSDRNIPIQIGTDNNWKSISSGSLHTLGLKADGTLWAWGYNSNGQLGDSTLIDKNFPIKIGFDSMWVGIYGGGYSSLGLKSDGTIWAWGLNLDGQVGDNTNTDKNSPVKIGMDTKWVSISAGYAHSLGLKSDGTLWSWGSNLNGQLGNSTSISKNNPIKIGVDNKWLTISSNDAHSLGLKSDGSLWAWGNNSHGQLGDSTNSVKNHPVHVGSNNNWQGIFVGALHSLGIKSDGTLWAWGLNTYGELGDGTTIDKNYPIQIGTENTWINIAPGNTHTLGLKSNGTLWAWGNNLNGRLGDGTNTDKNSPVQIGTDKNWISISAGAGHSLALKADGTLWAWGLNNYGQLGNGTNTDVSSPVQIGTDSNWVVILAGYYHSLAIKADGTLWGWGNNSFSILGNGTNTATNIPLQSGTDQNWISIASYSVFSQGIKSDGTLWGWGMNTNGQLGNGTNTNQINPIQIGNETKWVTISTGSDHSIGLKADRNQFCATGGNQFGQLGICSNTFHNTYVCQDLPIGIYSSPINTLVCPGNSALFSVSATSVSSYQWQEYYNLTWNNLADIGLYSGTATATLLISSATINLNNRKYRCVLNSASPCPPSDTSAAALLSVVIPLANISTLNGLTSFCVGDKFVLSANVDSGATYKWYKNGNLLVGRISDTLSISSGGSYSVEVTLSTNCSAISSAANISSIVKPPANITASGNTTFCKGSFVTLNGNSGAGFSRQWQLNGVDIPNAIFVSYAADSAGVYTLKATNSQGCDSISNPIQVSVYPYPIAAISYSASPYTCTGNSVILTASQGIGYTYQWLLNGNTIAGATDSTYAATGTSTNNYNVIVKNAGNCATTSATTVLNPVPLAPAICLVTVDSTSTNNIIYWEKTLGDTTIASYYVYRDISNNNFALIGIVPHDSLSLFVDTVRHLFAANGDPTATSWRYKIAVKDICGTFSTPSLFHQTIFFQDNGNGIFSWSEYHIEGQSTPVSQLNNYKIYRDSISTGNWKLIQTLSASSTSYNDIDYASYPNGRWKVEGLWNTSCNPTARILAGVNNTRSNIKNKTAPNDLSVYKQVENKIRLQPNPASQVVFVKSELQLDRIFIIDYLGREVLSITIEDSKAGSTSVNISKLIAGMYTVVCKGKEVEVRKKLVVE